MSAQDLQHAVTSYHRFLDRLAFWSEEGEPVHPFQTREHLQRIDWFSEETYLPYSVRNFWLVPGGRFLVGSDDDELILWDLGYSSKQSMRQYPLTVGSMLGEPLAVGPTPDGKELVIAALPRYAL